MALTGFKALCSAVVVDGLYGGYITIKHKNNRQFHKLVNFVFGLSLCGTTGLNQAAMEVQLILYELL